MVSIEFDSLPPKAIFTTQLLTLSKEGSECEACGNRMHDHKWAIMDKYGFVLYCDIQLIKDKANHKVQTGH